MKAQVATKVVPYYNEKGFDRIIFDSKLQFYGVFDGMGVSEHAAFAADTAAEVVSDMLKAQYLDNNWRFMEGALIQASRNVAANPMAGCTATIAGVDTAGFLNYAHVGDSRLYVMHKGRIKQVTSDEGVGNMLLNYIGPKSRGVCQAGVIYEWDAFFLCSDGITGDWPDQFIDDADIEDIINKNNPEEAIERLIERSKKNDDKSLIIYKKEK